MISLAGYTGVFRYNSTVGSAVSFVTAHLKVLVLSLSTIIPAIWKSYFETWPCIMYDTFMLISKTCKRQTNKQTNSPPLGSIDPRHIVLRGQCPSLQWSPEQYGPGTQQPVKWVRLFFVMITGYFWSTHPIKELMIISRIFYDITYIIEDTIPDQDKDRFEIIAIRNGDQWAFNKTVLSKNLAWVRWSLIVIESMMVRGR